jgi:RNA recognition motif-containing protein
MRSKLRVGNLPIDITADALRALFAQAGKVIIVSLITDPNVSRKKGSAYVTMSSRAEALKAIGLFRGYRLGNRKLTLVEERSPHYTSRKSASPGGRGIFKMQGLTGDSTTEAPPPEKKKKPKGK